ncbi:MAG: carboxypeptidase-like regulatory domain-containing protein [Terriglobia bacterium]
MRTTVGWVLLMACVSAAGGAETGGTIKGVVVNETGTPVAGAQVLPLRVEVKPSHHVHLPIHEADDEGRFSIENLPWGTYTVSADKEDDGYPNASFGVFADHNHPFPVVTLELASPTAVVTIHLPPKAGAIQSISVVDAVTGMEMNSAAITLRRAAEPTHFVGTSTTMTPILVPSNTDVSVEITATGYKSWPGKGEPIKTAQIKLSPEQGVKLEVKLAPDGSKVNSVALFSPAPYAPARNIARPGPKPSNPILSKAVEPFSVTADDISVPLEKLARQYQVPIGFGALPHGAGTKNTASVRIDVETGTVRDVLNAIIAADPVYTWEEADPRTINILPRDHADSLLDVVVSTYSFQVADAGDGINDLLKAPEVQRWMAREGVKRQELSGATSHPSTASAKGGHVRRNNASVRMILNTLLIFSDSHYWTYYRYGDHNQFFVLSTGD